MEISCFLSTVNLLATYALSSTAYGAIKLRLFKVTPAGRLLVDHRFPFEINEARPSPVLIFARETRNEKPRQVDAISSRLFLSAERNDTAVLVIPKSAIIARKSAATQTRTKVPNCVFDTDRVAMAKLAKRRMALARCARRAYVTP